MTPSSIRLAPLAWFTAAMVLVILSSNILVQTPLNDWMTWRAITYPFSFLITDLANRYYGPRFARRLVYIGFVIALRFEKVVRSGRTVGRCSTTRYPSLSITGTSPFA